MLKKYIIIVNIGLHRTGEELRKMIIAVTILLLIYSLFVLIAGSIWSGKPCSSKALSTGNILFMLYTDRVQLGRCLFLYEIQLDACLFCLYCQFHSSNHFVVTLNIISLFSFLILVFYHIFKITKPLPRFYSI